MQSIERRVHVPGDLLVPNQGTANFQNGVVEGGGPSNLVGYIHIALWVPPSDG